MELGGKPKWLLMKIGYYDVMHADPINREGRQIASSVTCTKGLFARS